jgi:hypothetical protein
MDPATLRPPEEASVAAAYGLDLRRRFGRGGTEVGVSRALLLVSRAPLDLADVRVVSAWFARHGAARRSAVRPWGQDRDPSAAWIAWHLWGGDACRAWADDLLGRRPPPMAEGIGDPALARVLRELALA